MLSKQKVQEQIALFPDNFSLDELVEKLILIEKIEIGISQSINNDVISDKELGNEIEKW